MTPIRRPLKPHQKKSSNAATRENVLGMFTPKKLKWPLRVEGTFGICQFSDEEVPSPSLSMEPFITRTIEESMPDALVSSFFLSHDEAAELFSSTS